MPEVQLTEAGRKELEERLEYLKSVRRAEIAEEIKTARGFGDLSENAEYDAAREEQRSNEGKIAEIEYKIKNADVREEVTDNSYVHLNSVVTVFDEDMEEEEVYTITSITEVDALHGKISIDSPVGSALMRKHVGDKASVVCPDGSSYTLKILKIS